MRTIVVVQGSGRQGLVGQRPTPAQNNSWPVFLKSEHRSPFFQNGAKSGFEMCFDIGSQHLGCWGQNTSRIQNKEVHAALYLQARVTLSRQGITQRVASKCHLLL